MKFPKLNFAGLIKAPKGLVPKEKAPEQKLSTGIKPLASPMSKFIGLKRELDRNISKKYKV